jgi:DNA-binding response OmpR family regulator
MGKLAGKCVLVIEDEALINMLLEDILESEGATVLGPATTLASALRLAASQGIDAAIVDVNLGAEQSYPAARLLAERGVPFVFTTAYARRSDPALEHAPFLGKPYGVRDLLQAVEALVD